MDTILSRDYQLVHETSLATSALKDLLTYLASLQGEPLKLKEAGEFAQISKVTIKKVIQAFESLFLIREVSAHVQSGEVKRAYYLEDQGMASWLTLGHQHAEHHHITRGIYANLRQELFYEIGNLKKINYFRTKNGVTVPLVFQVGEKWVGIIPSSDTNPTSKIYSSAESFLKAVPNSIAVIACANPSPRFLHHRMFQLPFWTLT